VRARPPPRRRVSTHERRRLSRHPQPHRCALRAVASDSSLNRTHPMPLTRQAIVERLQDILGTERVLTDERVLKHSSIDNFRKLQKIFDVYTMPLPAAVAIVHSTEAIARVLAFADEHRVNIVSRTGGTATEGGLETPVENSVVVDGSQMNDIIEIDPYNMQATAQCGVPLQVLEDRARELGLTTGHSPQSKPVAQMGGLVA